MKFTPLADRLLIEPLTTEAITKGGIIIPDMAKKKQNIGIVRAVGQDKMYEEDIPLAPGDKVLFEENAGVEHKEGGIAYRIVRRDSVLIKYNEA